MNIINDAKKAIQAYNSLDDDKYYRQNEGSHHQVNVKRYDDLINTSKLYQKHKQAILDQFRDDDIYALWIDWLNFEVEDLHHYYSDQGYKYLSEIQQRGRSGGYITFDDDAEQYANELDEWIDPGNSELYPSSEYIEDIKEYTKILFDTIKEVETAKELISSYNNSLDFKDKIIFRLDELVDELEEEEKSLQSDQSRFITDITAITNTLSNRLDQFKGDDTLKNSINRNLQSIKKIVKK